ncbi:MAG: preprotein translocase subunit SecG [Deltaproteobacteria bacterium]|nr:preprotein translocase subunit SecG [Deltaproteobacteria bacterium]MBT4087520.1 preprotein translocase subunit SecG [Deltaproteobacteria bacterium]MBT4263128.1 preprotein translocase subunit SecG [Deltaproteobacteria bacterium]MBT4637336.1 preprotein translocase subunit SecG [Deltaproteobacteria bacterium]MBT6504816.1 preprotein translocase subunit SecG [Deltaproteobacteria bacterium]
MNTPLIVIHIIVCITIILIVLLQVGRGAEAGAVFGGTGQVHSSRGQATFVGKLTYGLAVVFILTSFSLTYTTSKSAKSSVIDKVSQEQLQQGVEKDSTEKSTPATESNKAAE